MNASCQNRGTVHNLITPRLGLLTCDMDNNCSTSASLGGCEGGRLCGGNVTGWHVIHPCAGPLSAWSLLQALALPCGQARSTDRCVPGREEALSSPEPHCLAVTPWEGLRGGQAHLAPLSLPGSAWRSPFVLGRWDRYMQRPHTSSGLRLSSVQRRTGQDPPYWGEAEGWGPP